MKEGDLKKNVISSNYSGLCIRLDDSTTLNDKNDMTK
jgi:hypothetical protein